MDDGAYTGSGLRLSTDAFSDKDLNLLIKGLDQKLGIKANKHIHNKAKGQYTLYISKDQLPGGCRGKIFGNGLYSSDNGI